jgi:hypothetical protein
MLETGGPVAERQDSAKLEELTFGMSPVDFAGLRSSRSGGRGISAEWLAAATPRERMAGLPEVARR